MALHLRLGEVSVLRVLGRVRGDRDGLTYYDVPIFRSITQLILDDNVMPQITTQTQITVSVRDMMGKEVHLEIHFHAQMKTLMEIYCDRTYQSYHGMRVFFRCQRVSDRDFMTLAELGIEDSNRIQALPSMTGDIGYFAQHMLLELSPGRKFLQDNAALLEASAADAERIVNTLCPTGAPDLPTCCLSDAVLNAHAYATLIAFVNNLRVRPKQPSRIDVSYGKHDEQVRVSLHELLHLVGAEQAQQVLRLYGSSVDSIIIRRVTATAQGHFIAFHTDTGSSKTMQIPLNPESEYEGGRLVYATINGFLRPARPPGSFTIHEWNMPHGVTALKRVVRYRWQKF
jgi:hypothetical protein